ncbi:MAG: pyridoxamine 5'-phosphate oxidase [Bacteroidota bacterium]|nr:pyridoxamine 5'-phosphate oxidase [Bacteroidota bacterium]
MLNINIADIRKDYKLKSLLEKDVDADPLKQFRQWWNEAIESKVEEVNAMTLATSNKNGMPSARIVLLKGFNEKGFIFFTNYESRKGKELKENPHACLVFFWKELERQIRIEGAVKKLGDKESDEYFIIRPEQSRISAWSSPQSQVISGREVLENNFTKYLQQFSEGTILRPPNWGGYIVSPQQIEFWQGRPNRLHDRLRYCLKNNSWKIERLAP